MRESKFIQDLFRTFFAWVADTFHEIHDWFLCTELGRWWRNLTEFKRDVAKVGFGFIVAVILMSFGAHDAPNKYDEKVKAVEVVEQGAS